MGEAVGYTGVVIAVVSLLGTVASNINARKANKDKLDHEVKMKELELNAAAVSRELDEVRRDLAECREQHETSADDRRRLQEQNDTLAKTVEQVKKQCADLQEQLAQFNRINAITTTSLSAQHGGKQL